MGQLRLQPRRSQQWSRVPWIHHVNRPSALWQATVNRAFTVHSSEPAATTSTIAAPDSTTATASAHHLANIGCGYGRTPHRVSTSGYRLLCFSCKKPTQGSSCEPAETAIHFGWNISGNGTRSTEQDNRPKDVLTGMYPSMDWTSSGFRYRCCVQTHRACGQAHRFVTPYIIPRHLRS